MRGALFCSLVVVVLAVPAWSAEPSPAVSALVIRVPIGMALPFDDATQLRVWPEELCSVKPGAKGLVLTCGKVGKGTLEVTHADGKLTRDMLDVVDGQAREPVAAPGVVPPTDVTPTPGETITLARGQAVKRTFAGLTRLAVGDAAIADATVAQGGEVTFAGKAAGETSALLWMTGGKVLSVRLRVTAK